MVVCTCLPLMKARVSSMPSIGMTRSTGPKISLEVRCKATLLSTMGRDDSLRHEGIISSDILHDSWRNVALRDVRVATDDDRPLRPVDHLLDTRRMLL